MRCGICEDVCRFDAIREEADDLIFRVNPLACEGCAACYHQCPEGAIELVPRLCGHWFRSASRYGPLLHARLRPAQENSGKLVSLVKEEARALAREKGIPFLIVDGPPGIGCPAIAALAEADLALLVAEPTVSGIHDLERALDMADHFRVRTLVTVNKGNLHPEGMDRIEERCRERGVPTLEWIPFDEAVTRAMIRGLPVTEHHPDSPASWALVRLWEDVKRAFRSEEVRSPRLSA
jgi:MinD superfamily P-loop ATPase